MGLFSSLFGIGGSQKTVRAEFVHEEDGAIIAISDMPPEQLPDTFAIATTLEMQGKKWAVERAEPEHKFEILKAGKVRVYIAPLTTMPPGDLLFSLPTISDDMGAATGDALPSPEIFALQEDDWRQAEFVAQRFSAEVEAELADIRRIYQSERAGVGFKTLHVRKRIPNPLEGCRLSLHELEALVEPQRKFLGLGFDRTRGTVPGGFAWHVDEHCRLWGTSASDGNITHLCLLGRPGRQAEQLAKSFAKVNAQHQLVFVNWCRVTSITSDVEGFRSLFSD